MNEHHYEEAKFWSFHPRADKTNNRRTLSETIFKGHTKNCPITTHHKHRISRQKCEGMEQLHQGNYHRRLDRVCRETEAWLRCTAPLVNHLVAEWMREYSWTSNERSVIGYRKLPLTSPWLNPLSPDSDQHQFSPKNIHMLPREMIMRVIKMITKEKMLWSVIKLSQLFF